MSSPVRILALLLLLTGLAATPGIAGEPAVLQLTVVDAIDRALQQHPDLQLVRNRQAAAALDVSTARGRFLPSLEASANAAGHLAQQPPPGDTRDYRTFSLGLASRLNLFNGLADVAALGRSRALLDAADADVLREQQNLAYAVASRFIETVTAGELTRVAEESLARERALLEQVEAFYRAGTRSVTDLYQQQAAAAQAELELLSAQRDREVVELQLLQAMGEQPPQRLELQAPDPQALVEALGAPELETALEQALQLRPDLLAQRQRSAAAQEQVRQARSGYLPSLDLYADAGSGYSSLASGRDFGSQLSRDAGSATLGLSLSVPIFDRNVTRNSVAQARIGEQDADVTLARLRQQVGVEVGSALADYRTAGLQLQVAEAKLTYARQALEAAEARYRVGAATWVDLAAARATDAGARADLVRARQGLLQRSLAVGYARGDLDALLARLFTEEPQS